MEHRFNWKRLNAIGSLVCDPDGSQPDIVLHLQPKTIKEDAVIAYLQALHRQVPGPIVLFLDGLPAHRSAKVADYLQANTDWLEVVWFPGYAPELNPIEYFWSALKGKPLANSGSGSSGSITERYRARPSSRQKKTEVLQEFLVASSLYKKEMFVNTSGESQ